jgi:hypothetical protein
MSPLSRLVAILSNGFLAPLFLMLGLHGFGLHCGYWPCFLLTTLGAVLWGLLPGYIGKEK